MANYNILKAAIQAAIYENGNNEITGAVLQQTLLSMISSLGDGYQFMGIATLTTNPGTPDQKVFYVASEIGQYPNFGGLVVSDGEVAIFKYDGTWTKDATGAASLEQVGQLDQNINGEIVYKGIASASRQNKAVLRTTGVVESIPTATSSVVDTFNVSPNTKYLISGRVGTGENSCLVCFYDANNTFIEGSAKYTTQGVATPFLDIAVESPDNASIMKIAGNNVFDYLPAAKVETRGRSLEQRIYDSLGRLIVERPLPLEVGSLSGVANPSMPLTYLESDTRIRIDLPIKDIVNIRIVQDGWAILMGAVYAGAIPTTEKAGVSYASSPAAQFNVAEFLSSHTLSFTPERVIAVIIKSDGSSLSGITSVDNVVAVDYADKSLYGREVVVMGDSSCDVSYFNCWAKLLQSRATMLGIQGHFLGVRSTGWSTSIATPNVLSQWNGEKSNILSTRPIIIITTGGNEIENLQLSYDDTMALCRATISTPSTPGEWAVHTLRTIINDKPMARIYLVSNFYASSTPTKDSQRLVYREMLRALCDYFSITLIDMTRNSQIRGYLENDSSSSGYHLYSDDGTHATRVAGRNLIYAKIMGQVIENEKWRV